MKQKMNMVLLTPIPALCIGAIAMYQSGISPLLYGQNILCFLLLSLLVLFLSSRMMNIPQNTPVVMAFLALCCAMLTVTLYDQGLEKVHRWFAIGSFRLYVSSLILPSATIGIGVLLKRKHYIPSIVMVAIVGVCLVLQPDAAQLTAFAIATVFLVWVSSGNRVLKLCLALTCTAFITYSWINIDTLAPVPHVEGILYLALDIGVMWFMLGIVSLVLMVLPFFTLFKGINAAKAIGLYYSIMIGSTFFGHFPVPFMGQGISPIVGYLLAVFLLLHMKPGLNADPVI